MWMGTLGQEGGNPSECAVVKATGARRERKQTASVHSGRGRGQETSRGLQSAVWETCGVPEHREALQRQGKPVLPAPGSS